MAAKSTPATTWIENIYGIYLAIVCATSLLILAILMGSLINSAIDYAFPRELSYPVEKFVYDQPGAQPRQLSEPEIAERRETEIRNMRSNEVRGFAHSAIYFLIAAAVYLGHRRLFRQRLKMSK